MSFRDPFLNVSVTPPSANSVLAVESSEEPAVPLSQSHRPAIRGLIVIGLALALINAGGGRVAGAPPLEVTAVTGGAFFERADADGLGFAIRNYADGPAFYDAYLRLGGAQTLGPPVSRPWVDDGGLAYQVTQRVLLQWSPADDQVGVASLFELLNDAEFGDELRARHIPAADTPPSLAPLVARQARLDWMTDRAIAEKFSSTPIGFGSLDASIEFHGLPMSRPVRLGPFVVQRFQRTALQHWVEQVENGQPAGSVVLVNAGDIYRDLALPDELLAEPHQPEHAAVLDVRLDPPADADLQTAPIAQRVYNTTSHILRTALALLEGVEVNDVALEFAESAQLAIGFDTLPIDVLATYHASLGIRVNEKWRNEDPPPLAAVLAHELRHFEDFQLGQLGEDSQSCLDAEARALTREAETWNALVPDDDASPQASVLVRIQNSRAAVYAEGPDAIAELAVRLYREVCARTPTGRTET